MSARSKPCSGQRHFSQHGLRSATPPRTSRRRQWTAASLDLESGRTGTGCLLLHTTLPLLRGRVQQPHQAGASRRGHLLPPASSGSLHPPTNHYREDVERWPTGWRYQSQPKRDSCCNASRCWLLAKNGVVGSFGFCPVPVFRGVRGGRAGERGKGPRKLVGNRSVVSCRVTHVAGCSYRETATT